MRTQGEGALPYTDRQRTSGTNGPAQDPDQLARHETKLHEPEDALLIGTVHGQHDFGHHGPEALVQVDKRMR
jgi:hypothetical protein